MDEDYRTFWFGLGVEVEGCVHEIRAQGYSLERLVIPKQAYDLFGTDLDPVLTGQWEAWFSCRTGRWPALTHVLSFDVEGPSALYACARSLALPVTDVKAGDTIQVDVNEVLADYLKYERSHSKGS